MYMGIKKVKEKVFRDQSADFHDIYIGLMDFMDLERDGQYWESAWSRLPIFDLKDGKIKKTSFIPVCNSNYHLGGAHSFITAGDNQAEAAEIYRKMIPTSNKTPLSREVSMTRTPNLHKMCQIDQRLGHKQY